MARSQNYNGEVSKDGPLELAGMVFVVIAVMVGLVWLAASNKIVFYWTPALRSLGSVWSWLPGDSGTQMALSIYTDARAFLVRPAEIGFFEYMGFVNRAIAPATTVATLACAAWFLLVLKAPKADVFRRFTNADDLLRRMSFVFTGTAPILHIRQQIAKHAEPRWARQRTPEEILFDEKIYGKPLVTGSRSAPDKTQVHTERIEEWYRGLPAPDKRTRGRQFSITLGQQMVDLGDTADLRMFSSMPKADTASFADRFTDVGKIMFGMLCAHAFGGSQGVKDAHKARDQLNNSCRGAKHGLPNLKVGQWVFDKYRGNELAHKMFAVHHWEYTYLFELFVQAKRRGKFTDGEFRWLKPASRMLWYALNTVGRFVPHAESAATFNMHAFERRCARRNRWPVRLRSDNSLEHVIFVKGAAEGLVIEFERWRDGVDENDDEWWQNRHHWLTPEAAVMATMKAPAGPGDTEAATQMLHTGFDSSQTKARAKSAAKLKKTEADAFSSLLDE